MGDTERKLADLVVNFKTEDIPDDVMHLAKRCLMNYAGVALYATLDPSIGVLLDLFKAEGGSPLATVLGKGVRTSTLNAALANGYLGHFEDYDDTHTTVIHPSSPIYPAALALTEQGTVSGRDLLGAFVLGVEVACRIGLVVSEHFREGAEHWHITNTCGVLGAASAAGRLLGLNEGQMVHAFAVAGTQAHGVREVFGSMCKPFHAGSAARNGLLAAMLVQRGFTGTDDIFEGPRGLVGAMSTGYDITEATKNLGAHWELSANGLKPYSCGAANHGFIDAAIAIRNRGLAPDAIKHMEGSIPRIAPALVRRRHPRTGLESKFCYYHSIAVGLADGQALPAQYTDEKAVDLIIASVRDKVDIHEDPSLQRRTSVIEVELKDGTSFTENIPYATGTPENPMRDEMVQEKFAALSAAVLPTDKAKKAAEALWRIDGVPDFKEVVPLLCE